MITTLLDMRQATRVHGSGENAVTALDRCDLRIDRGEFVAVMGPSGSGKSTLLHLAGGLDTPTSGEVLIEGTDLAAMRATDRALLRRHRIGYVFQDFNLLPALSAADNVAFPLELDGEPRARARQEALHALAEVDIAELADRFPDEMSGGQAQRVAIARALVGSRKLLLADEPTGALDSATGETIMRVLRARADHGAGILLVTHEPRFAAWADRTVFLRDGRVIDSAQPTSFEFAGPQS